MAPQPPSSDSRRASALRSLLLDITPSVAPDWFGPSREGTFGRAMVEIASRMGEETTRRLDQTARRDLAAFFDAIDIAPDPPQAAEAVAVFSLAENRESPVFAPRRVRLAANVENADVTFETDSALSLTPSRLMDLIAVDSVTDRIERSPETVTIPTQPVEEIESYELVGFVDQGSDIIQLNPSTGVDDGDLLRIGNAAYRVDKIEDGLIRLLDPLEEPADDASPVRKVTAFETYDTRDVQEHSFFVGHESLFNLEQTAQISLCFTPSSVSQRLANLNVSFALWGTVEGETEPAWQPVDQLRASGGVLTLSKDWVGTVDKVDIEGQSNRWLRVSLVDPLEGPNPISISATQLDIRVRSQVPDTRPVAPAPQASGTNTIQAAFTNQSPLAVSGRFLPFGADPLRADVFAVAAPEALSKRGAEVGIDFTVVDESVTIIDVSDSADGGTRAYGVGPNGALQFLPFGNAGERRWQTVEPPEESVEFDNTAIHTATVDAGGGAVNDLVVVADRRGQWWSARIRVDAGTPADPVWHRIATFSDGNGVDGEMTFESIALVPVASSGRAVLVTAGQGAIYALMLDADGDDPEERWQQVTFDRLSGSLPALDKPARFAPIGGNPPAVSADFAEANLILADAVGQLWQVMIDPQRLTGNLYLLDDKRLSASDVLPVASFFDTDQGEALWVAWAAAGDRSVAATQKLGMGSPIPIEFPAGNQTQFSMPSGGRFLIGAPSTVNNERPPTAAIGVDGRGRAVAMVWQQGTQAELTPLPETLTNNPAPTGTFLIPSTSGGAPSVAFAGPSASLYVSSNNVEEADVDVTLHDGVTYTGSIPVDRLILEPAPAEEASIAYDLSTRLRITSGETKVYDLSGVDLLPSQQYRFLQTVISPVGNLQATPQRVTNRDKIRLDVADADTKQNDYLEIEGRAYQIEGVERGVATLRRRLPEDIGDLVEYSTLRIVRSAGGRLRSDDFATLVKINGAAGLVSGSRLVFENATPNVQQIEATATQQPALQPNELWVKVDSAWVVRPPVIDGISRATIAGRPPGSDDWLYEPPSQTATNPELVWEFYDGDGWRLLENLNDSTGNLLTSGSISFQVPETIQPVTIGGRQDYWLRATLVGGDYGQAEKVTTVVPVSEVEGATRETVTFDRSGLRPPEIAAIEARFEQVDVESAESLLVRNNLETIDQTQAAAVPSARFELFNNVASLDRSVSGRALYLGFDKPIGVNPLNLFVDVEDRLGDGSLAAEILSPAGWRNASLLDGTKGMRRRNTVGVFLNDNAAPTQLFGAERYWLRLRPQPDIDNPRHVDIDDEWSPVIRGLFPNAVSVRQARTIDQELVGTSLGEPSLRLALSETPVLPDSLELRVREKLVDEEIENLAREYDAVNQTGISSHRSDRQVAVTLDDVAGTWVLWRRVESFVGLDGDARVYQVDPGSGAVVFGDGRNGKIPPAGRDAIRAFEYQHGGGAVGNVKDWTEMSLRSTLEGVDDIALPVGAVGGADVPTGDETYTGAPDRLRHSGQALTPADFEALAVASSTDIVNACCFFPEKFGDPIRLVIAQRTSQRCPQPTVETVDVVSERLRSKGWGNLTEDALVVEGPQYISVKLRIVIRSQPGQVSQVEENTANALVDFLDPIEGGPSNAGWPFGRGLWKSDILRLVESVDDVEMIESVKIEVCPESKGCADIGPDSIPTDALICALPDNIDVSVEPVEVRL